MYQMPYGCVNLSSIVQDFSPVIYYRSQLSFTTMSFPECVLQGLQGERKGEGEGRKGEGEKGEKEGRRKGRGRRDKSGREKETSPRLRVQEYTAVFSENPFGSQ